MARANGIDDDDLAVWLGSIPIENWQANVRDGTVGCARSPDAISDGQADALRRLLDEEEVELTVPTEVPAGELTLVVDDTSGIRVVGIHSGDNAQYFPSTDSGRPIFGPCMQSGQGSRRDSMPLDKSCFAPGRQ
jgi:hypothetical protein